MILKHLAHNVFMTTFLVGVVYLLTVFGMHSEHRNFNPWKAYGTIPCAIMYALRMVFLLATPHYMLNFLGLLCFNPFPGKVTLRCRRPDSSQPFLCLRVVTRGYYPRLLRDNLQKNIAILAEAGINDYLIEVVTEKDCSLPQLPQVRQLVIPPSYVTKTGALYKCRALQYCLEDNVNILKDDDYIVHLDEESVLTLNSVNGIMNFAVEGKYDFGQGLITYADQNVVNWITTLADGYRVCDDMGRLKAQFKFFHRPVFGWKGSFMVSKVGAERKISFDHGIEGSITEDCYFSIKALQENYEFDFIEGEIHEQSPFTICDFIRQRRRWLQGNMLVVSSSKIHPFVKAYYFTIWLVPWITMPFTNILIGFIFPLPMPQWLNFAGAVMMAYSIYMYLFGILKAINPRKLGPCTYVLCIVFVFVIQFVSMLLESAAVLAYIFDPKISFHIVQKESWALKEKKK